ncbi:MAG: hypothetical protein IJW81_00030, partial [Clostridia bacterium]|nr:hypothetical protein [Clostridia bacterium]
MLNKEKTTGIFVAVSGSDTIGDGSFEHPFATIPAAQAMVRKMIENGGLTQDVTICLREGTYYQKEPITVTPADCDNRYTVTYTSYNDEDVRIVGGLPVTGWTDADGDGIFEADITGFGSVYALYENGVRLQNARETDWQNKPVRDPSHLQAVYGSTTSWFGEVLKVSELTGDSIRTEYRKCDWSGSL